MGGKIQFLLRDAICKRGLCCHRVSIHLACWCIVSTRLKISLNFFLGQIDKALQFFYPQHWFQIPRISGGTQYTRVGNFCDFRL